jgi:hypothetical protein
MRAVRTREDAVLISILSLTATSTAQVDGILEISRALGLVEVIAAKVLSSEQGLLEI